MVTKIKKQKLETEVKAFIMQAIQEILDDSDFGLELSELAKKRLKRASSFRGKTLSFSEIKGKYS